MTRDEQIQLTAIAGKLERYAGRTEEALTHTKERLDRIDKNVGLIREAFQAQAAAQTAKLASMEAVCKERGSRLTEVERCVREIEQGDLPRYDPSIVTPVQPVPLPATTQAIRKSTDELHAARSDRAWRWLRERTTTILAIIALVVTLGGAGVWMVKAYEKIERMQAAVVHAADGGIRQ